MSDTSRLSPLFMNYPPFSTITGTHNAYVSSTFTESYKTQNCKFWTPDGSSSTDRGTQTGVTSKRASANYKSSHWNEARALLRPSLLGNELWHAKYPVNIFLHHQNCIVHWAPSVHSNPLPLGTCFPNPPFVSLFDNVHVLPQTNIGLCRK